MIDWDLHLAAFRAMIPWFFACDRTNYARYGSAYWVEMTTLDQAHPGSILLVIFPVGHFSVLLYILFFLIIT